jgi:hypothetical protein
MDAPRWKSVIDCKATDCKAVLLLIALSLAFKIVVLCQHPILARDGIHYLRFARDLTQRPWQQVLHDHPYHPAYPLVIAGLAEISTGFHAAELSPEGWQWCAHAAASLGGLLLLVPLYGLARCFFSLPRAWLGVCLFCMLPATVQLTTDTLAESWLLVFLFSALWALAVGLRRQEEWKWFAWAGFCAGAGYWVRLEALILPAAALIVLLTRRWWQTQVFPWRGAFRDSIALVACFLVSIAPYVAALGKLSPRPSMNQILQACSFEEKTVSIGGPQVLLASRMQQGVNGLHVETRRVWDAVKLVSASYVKAGNYFLWPLVFLGLLVRPRPRLDLRIGLLWCVGLLSVAVLLRLAYSAGYASERHALPVAALACLFAGSAIFRWGVILQHAWSQARFRPLPGASKRGWAVVLLLVLAATCAPKALQPLHGSQEGHRQAGLWLAKHLRSADRLVDPYHWASYYAGRAWQPFASVDAPGLTGVVAVVDPRDADLNRREAWRQAGVLEQDAVTLLAWPSEDRPRLLIKQARSATTAQSR